MTDCLVSHLQKALTYISPEGSDNISLSTAANAVDAPRETKKREAKEFLNVWFVSVWFGFACLFWSGHTRKHLTSKLTYANVLNIGAHYSCTTTVILLYIYLVTGLLSNTDM